MKLEQRTGLLDEPVISITKEDRDSKYTLDNLYQVLLIVQIEKIVDIQNATKDLRMKHKKKRMYVDKDTFHNYFPSIFIDDTIFVPYELFMYAYKRLKTDEETQNYMDDIYHYIKATKDYPTCRVGSFILIKDNTISLCTL